MNFKHSVLVVASLFMAIVDSSSALLEVESSLGLLNFMARSNRAMNENPSRSTNCFDYYIPLIGDISKTYQNNLAVCQDRSNDERLQAEDATLDKRNDLAALSNTACDALAKCKNIPSAVDVFECYIQGGSANSNVMDTIRDDASDGVHNLREELRLIEGKQLKCNNDTRRAYEKENTQALEDLNSCILGYSPVPTTTTTTTETAVVTTSSVEPEVSTVSENPEVSTTVSVESPAVREVAQSRFNRKRS